MAAICCLFPSWANACAADLLAAGAAAAAAAAAAAVTQVSGKALTQRNQLLRDMSCKQQEQKRTGGCGGGEVYSHVDTCAVT